MSYKRIYAIPRHIRERLIVLRLLANVGEVRYQIELSSGRIIETTNVDLFKLANNHFNEKLNPTCTREALEKGLAQIKEKLKPNEEVEAINSFTTPFYRTFSAIRKDSDEKLLLFVASNSNGLPLGEQQLLIRPLTTSERQLLLSKPPTERGLLRFRKEFGRTEEWTSFVNSREELIFAVELGLTKPQLRSILSWDWEGFIQDLTLMGADSKDPRLITCFKSFILPNWDMRTAPHSLAFLNPGVGKSVFYTNNGKRLDKATKKSLAGTAFDPEHISYGAVHGYDRTIAIEQIEEQAEDLLGFLLSFMDDGRCFITAGGVNFVTEGKPIIIFSGNPDVTSDDKQSFASLVGRLTETTVNLGRRIGIILYSRHYQVVKWKQFDEEEIDFLIELRDQIMNWALPHFKDFWQRPEVRQWIHQDLPQYRETVSESIGDFDKILSEFWLQHAMNATRRIRGAPLRIALLESIPTFIKTHLDNTQVESKPILEKAEEYLQDILDINLGSLEEIVQEQSFTERVDWSVYTRLPDDLRALVRTVHTHYQTSPSDQFKLDTLDPTFKKLREQEDFGWVERFSRVEDNLRKRKHLSLINEKIARFNIKLELWEDGLHVLCLGSPKMPSAIKATLGEKRDLIVKIVRDSPSGLINAVDLLYHPKVVEMIPDLKDREKIVEKLVGDGVLAYDSSAWISQLRVVK